MSSQTTVVTTQPKSGAALARKKRITKYVANKRMSRVTSLASARSRFTDSLRLPRGFRQTVMPERFTTTVVASQQFYLPAAALDAANGNYASFRVNSLISPFNTTYPATAVAAVFAMNGQYVQGYTSNTNGIGTTVLSSIYDKYKVVGYKIRVSIMTSTNSDLLEACLVPLGQDEIPSTATTNMSVFKGQPKAAYKLVHNGGPNAVLTLKGSVHELLGMRKQQWLDIDATNTTGGTLANPGYVGLYLQSLNGATNNQPVVVDLSLVQIVELTDIKNSVLVN